MIKNTYSIFVVIVTFLSLIGENIAIECFRCDVIETTEKVDNTTMLKIPMCQKFDEDDTRFIVDCPYSTMCRKTISILNLLNGQVQETITRGCAVQKDSTQVFRNQKWQMQHSVQEVYEEGCSKPTGNDFSVAKQIHCYCRGDLCNSSSTLANSYKILSLTIVSLLIACRLLSISQ